MTISLTDAVRQSQPVRIEMHDQSIFVHTRVGMTTRCMKRFATGKNHPSALEKDPVSCALMSDL